MAVTTAEVVSLQGNANTKIIDITFGADADTTSGNIAHGFGVAPEEVYLVPMHAACALALARVATIDATNVTVTKNTTAGSLASVYRLIMKRPTVNTR